MSRKEASELLAETVSSYGRLSSYQDDGLVVISQPGKDERQNTTFETIYLKPSLFRFQFTSPHPYKPLSHTATTTICGFDGSSSYLWTEAYDGTKKITDFVEFEMAIAGATGISSGSALNIAELLFPKIGKPVFSSLKNLSLGAEEEIDNTICREIKAGLRSAEADLSIYIDLANFIVRKWVTRFDSFISYETRHNIHVNEHIDRSRFARPGNET